MVGPDFLNLPEFAHVLGTVSTSSQCGEGETNEDSEL